MNPITNLIGKKFNELSVFELMQVISAYCDANEYFFDYTFKPKDKKDVIYYFESNFYQFQILETFFKYWTK
jgi:hypothetical protein